MKKIIISFILAVLFGGFYSVKSQQGWYKLPTYCNSNITFIKAIDPEIYFAGGDSDTLLISHDKGVSWIKIQIPGCFNMKDLKFVNDSTGYLLNNNALFKTTDKGFSWVQIPLSFHHFENRNLDFTNEQTGYICGGDDNPHSFVTITTDGGLSWNIQNFDIGDAVGIKFYNNFEGSFLICEKLYYTSNEGITWDHGTDIPICSYVKASSDSKTHYIGGDSGAIYKTTNYGLTWGKLETNTSKNILAINFISGSLGFAVGESGLILKTTNGGESWIKQVSHTTENLNSIHFINDEVGLISGENGVILRTITGGDILLSSGNNHNFIEQFYLGDNYPNPFNPFTKINYSLPFSSRVKLSVFDIAGKEISILVNETKDPGSYTSEFNSFSLSSGIYFYKLEAVSSSSTFVQTKKMVLVK